MGGLDAPDAPRANAASWSSGAVESERKPYRSDSRLNGLGAVGATNHDNSASQLGAGGQAGAERSQAKGGGGGARSCAQIGGAVALAHRERVDRIWTICIDHREWVLKVASAYGLGCEDVDGPSVMLERLIAAANAESTHMKRKIFRTVRCLHCFQHTKGGVKCELRLSLPAHYILWMEKVCETCEHASVDKTMRIVLDFYLSINSPVAERMLFSWCDERDRGDSEVTTRIDEFVP